MIEPDLRAARDAVAVVLTEVTDGAVRLSAARQRLRAAEEIHPLVGPVGFALAVAVEDLRRVADRLQVVLRDTQAQTAAP